MTTSDMTPAASTITVTCRKVIILRRSGSRRPLQDRTEYTCTGPDGRAFKLLNRTDLTQLLCRRYGPGTVLHFVAPDGSDPQ